jgi:hypothetical protein
MIVSLNLVTRQQHINLVSFVFISRSVLPKHFSTAAQFLERQSIATHLALLDKKKLF